MRARSGNIFNILAVLFLALSCLTVACVAAVFAFPGLIPAQFQPPTPFVVAVFTLPPPPLPVTPTITPTGPTRTPTKTRSTFQFTMQNDQPTYVKNFANTAGCGWMGIAGQVFDLNGNTMLNLLVHIEGGGLNYDAITGAKKDYGPGGYELYLGNQAKDTTDVFRVQLRSAQGQPLSDVYVIRTFADCNKNLILVNFVQNH